MNKFTSTEASLDVFLDLLNKKKIDKAFQIPYSHAKATGDARITQEFVRAYRSFMTDLVERHDDVILQNARSGEEAHKAAQTKRRLSEASQQHSGLTAVKPPVINPHGVIVRRSK